MDIIQKLQAYIEELKELANNKEYHEASRITGVIDKAEELIKKITEMELGE
jgi:FtsZ-binding cell division protein ZapB